jgi:hypothetical protein
VRFRARIAIPALSAALALASLAAPVAAEARTAPAAAQLWQAAISPSTTEVSNVAMAGVTRIRVTWDGSGEPTSPSSNTALRMAVEDADLAFQ